MTTLHGQLDSGIRLADLCGVLRRSGATCAVRGSSHYAGEEHALLANDVAELSFERVSRDEILVRGDGDCHAGLRALAWSATRALSEAELRHRLEVYEDIDRMWAYLRHDWPIKRVWLGHSAAHAPLAAGVAGIVRDAGATVTLRSFDRLPVADPLAALLADVAGQYDAAVWLLREDEEHDDWIVGESAVFSRLGGIEVSVYRACDGAVARSDGATIEAVGDNGEALAIVRDAFPWAHVVHRRLLVVDDTFLLRDRGLVLAPDVPLGVLPGSWQQKTRIGVCAPNGQARAFDAHVAIPFFRPADPNRTLAYTITLPGASKDDVPAGSEVWLDGGPPEKGAGN